MNENIAKAMRKKERIVSILMAAILSALLGAIAAFFIRRGMAPEARAATPAAAMYLTNILESIVVGILLVLILPFGKWGRTLADRFGAKPPTLKFTLLNCLPVSVGSSVLVSLIVSFVNVAQAHARIPAEAAPPLLGMWFSSWISLLPISIVASYILAALISPLIVKAVGLGGPPKGK